MGKRGLWWPPVDLKPVKILLQKLETWITLRGNTHAKFYGNRPRGVRPTNSQNITSCDFVYLPFPFLSFPFLFSCRRLQQKRIGDQYVKRRVFSQGCAFWGWENLNLIFNWFIWKNWKNYNGAYGENFKQFKTVVHNGCTQWHNDTSKTAKNKKWW